MDRLSIIDRRNGDHRNGLDADVAPMEYLAGLVSPRQEMK